MFVLSTLGSVSYFWVRIFYQTKSDWKENRVCEIHSKSNRLQYFIPNVVTDFIVSLAVSLMFNYKMFKLIKESVQEDSLSDHHEQSISQSQNKKYNLDILRRVYV